MANPTKFDLSIQKKDLDGKQLGAGFTFDLNGVQKTTSDGGVATWSGLTTGSYKLSETAAPSGYSTRYFAQLFAEKYPDLANLVNGTGMNLGYTYEVVDGDVVIKKITPWDSSENKILVLEAKNPPIAKVNFVKIDKVTNTPMRNVKFTVFYRPFESIEGQYSLTLPAAKPTVEETLAQFPTTTFTEQDFSGGKWLPQTRTTNGSGTFNLAGGDPGIYVFVETGTLNGYEILKDDNGNIVMHCVVAACGLPITGVSVTPAKTTVGGKDYDTLFYSLDSTTPIPVSVPNLPMATLKAAKVAKTGMLTGTDVKNWSVTLNLYDAATGGNKVGTITIPKNNSATNVYFKDPNDSSKNAYFSLGNFLSDHVLQYTDCGVILEFTISENSDGTFSCGDIGYIPTYCWQPTEGDARVLPSGKYLEKGPAGMTDEAHARLVQTYQEITEAVGSQFPVLEG